MTNFDVIKTVRLTEKGTRQGDFNQYTIIADRRANKTQIRKAVETLFKVNVTLFAGRSWPTCAGMASTRFGRT